MSAGEERYRRLLALFDVTAGGHDNPALRFFPFCADVMVDRLGLQPGAKVLDVATGTGAAAVAAAQRIEPGGRVMAVDVADAMLDRAEANVRKMALSNVDLHHMDARRLDFRSGYYDAVLCSLALFYLPDMAAALGDWLRVLKPGGRLAVSVFAGGVFQPQADLLHRRLQECGVDGAGDQPPWGRVSTVEQFRALLQSAGAADVQVEPAQLGYHLATAQDWWAVVWNSALRLQLEWLPPAQLEALREAHLAEVAALASDSGIWLDVPVLLGSALRPAARGADAPWGGQ
jgi:SAM-dependent methyltransferase